MKTKKTNDIKLENLVLNKINWDSRVSKSDVRLFTENGIVSVYGYFDENYRKDAVLSIIKSTQGVLSVIDFTQVLCDYQRSDKEIESILWKRLLDRQMGKEEWVDLSVERGIVSWTGSIKSARFKAWISKITWELSGVQDCYNLIRLQGHDFTPLSKSLGLMFSSQKPTASHVI